MQAVGAKSGAVFSFIALATKHLAGRLVVVKAAIGESPGWMGRFDESAAEAQRALQLDPISVFTMDRDQWALYMARHYDLLIEETRKSLELAPEFAWAHYDRAMVFLRMGTRHGISPGVPRSREAAGLE